MKKNEWMFMEIGFNFFFHHSHTMTNDDDDEAKQNKKTGFQSNIIRIY